MVGGLNGGMAGASRAIIGELRPHYATYRPPGWYRDLVSYLRRNRGNWVVYSTHGRMHNAWTRTYELRTTPPIALKEIWHEWEVEAALHPDLGPVVQVRLPVL